MRADLNQGKIMVMVKTDQRGEINGLLIGLIISVLLLIAATVTAAWAISGREDYKNNVEAKITEAVDKAVKAEDAKKDAQFAEDYKKPLNTWTGPADYGSIQMSYPKTWSGYADTKGNGSSDLNMYFSAGLIPRFDDPGSVFALRVQVLNQPYSSVLNSYSSLQKSGKMKASAYTLPKLPKVIGTRLVGQDTTKKNLDIVLLPLRSGTVKIWTEGGNYGNDFNNNILPNFSFSP